MVAVTAVSDVESSVDAVHCDHSFCTAVAAVSCIVIAYIASTPPAPGTPLHSTPANALVASASLVCWNYNKHTCVCRQDMQCTCVSNARQL
jgi:hypothetical protein